MATLWMMYPARGGGSGLGSDERVLSDVRRSTPLGGLYNILVKAVDVRRSYHL